MRNRLAAGAPIIAVFFLGAALGGCSSSTGGADGGSGGGGGVAGTGGAGGTGGGTDAQSCSGAPSGPSIASCSTGVPKPQQCLEFIGSFWTASTAQTGCSQDFSTAMPSCPTANRVGRCLRNCGRPEETLESFYSDGPTAFSPQLASAICAAYKADPVAPIFIP